jgi:glutamate 5-kinase
VSGQRIVVKLGTSVLTNDTRQLSRQRMLEIVQQIAALHTTGYEVIVVSSGAQAAGRERLNYPDFGKSMPAKQMLSAVGQGHLMHIYSGLFDIFNIVVGQVLLTRGDLSDRARYLNARDTLLMLIERRIVPIINENDTTATDELRVGDNDNLSALVANLLDAQLLVLLTDQPGLYTADPRHDASAELIHVVHKIDDNTRAIAGGAGTTLGTGGMATKIEAAQLASRSGVTTVIAAGREPQVLRRILAGEQVGTRFEPIVTHLEGRKRWLLAEKPRGTVQVDDGAAQAVLRDGVSLLPVGVTAVEGAFQRGATIAIVQSNGEPIAHGLANYNSDEIRQLVGVKSRQIVEILGSSNGDAVVHRNDMVLLS